MNRARPQNGNAGRLRGQRKRKPRAAGVIALVALISTAVACSAGNDERPAGKEQRPGTAPSPAPIPGDRRANGQVLSFTGDPFRQAPGDLVAVNPETGEERVLVEDVGVVYSARWSADGRWVAYESPGPGGTGLWVVSTSLEPRQVATNALTWMWSSTGADLATVVGQSSQPPRLYSGATMGIIDPVTGETTGLGAIPKGVGDVTSAPAWSPDGTRLVFGARGGALYSVDVPSGARSLLVRLPGEHLDSVDGIAWSPDGAYIAVMNDLEPGDGRLYVMNADGSDVRVLTEGWGPSVTWSPDGTRLAYVDASGPDEAVRVVPLDGPALTEIGSPPAVRCGDRLFCEDDLTWSPDGSRIAFRSAGRGSADVAAIDADGLGDAGRIDDLTYRSWDGGWYSCDCA